MAKPLSILLTAILSTSVLACAEQPTDTTTETDWSALEARPSFNLYKDAAGQFRFDLLTPTADVLVSSQGYVSRLGALNGLVSVLDNGAYRDLYVVKTAADGGASVKGVGVRS